MLSSSRRSSLLLSKKMTSSASACNWWLMKTEPHEFSIDDLKKVKTEPWTGVRNYQVRNFMRDGMEKGDHCFIYHSNTKIPGIVGLAKVVSDKAFPDPTQFDSKSKYYDSSSPKDKPRWMCVNVGFVEKFKNEVPLDKLKEIWADADSPIVRKGNRLSVGPVLTNSAVRQVLKLAESDVKVGVKAQKKESGARRQRDE